MISSDAPYVYECTHVKMHEAPLSPFCPTTFRGPHELAQSFSECSLKHIGSISGTVEYVTSSTCQLSAGSCAQPARPYRRSSQCIVTTSLLAMSKPALSNVTSGLILRPSASSRSLHDVGGAHRTFGPIHGNHFQRRAERLDVDLLDVAMALHLSLSSVTQLAIQLKGEETNEGIKFVSFSLSYVGPLVRPCHTHLGVRAGACT